MDSGFSGFAATSKMRIGFVSVMLLMQIGAGHAQTMFRREPKVLAPGATVYVDNGRCSPGKILRVTAAFKGSSRRKTCIPLDPKEASSASGEQSSDK